MGHEEQGMVSAPVAPRPTYCRLPRLPFRKLEGETVILNPRQSGVHVLNGTGSLIWELLDRSRSVDELVSLLDVGGRFEAEPGEMRRDVSEFLQELVQKGLVVAE